MIDDNRNVNIFAVITNTEDEIFGEALSKYPNLRKVIYNPEFKARPFYEPTSVAFVAGNSEELSQFLRNLRYLIRSPPYLVRQGYQFPITNIFVPPNYFNPSFLETLITDN